MRIKSLIDHGRCKMVKNNSNNEMRMVEFKGVHPYFIEGECYGITEYAEWTRKFSQHGPVARACLKGRLAGRTYCEPHCLLPKEEYVAENQRRREKEGPKSEVAKRFLRLETKAMRLADKFLRVSL